MIKHWHRQGRHLPELNMDEPLPKKQPRLHHHTLLWPERDTRRVQAFDMRSAWTEELQVRDPVTDRKNPSILVVGKYLYFIGGHLETYQTSKSLGRLNVLTNERQVLSPMNETRAAGPIVALDDGRILAARGSSEHPPEMYDPVKNQWDTIIPMHQPRHYHAAAVLDGKIYVAGGETTRLLASVECFDPDTKKWSKLPRMISRRKDFKLVT